MREACLAFAASLLVLFTTSDSAADEKAVCVDAAESGQVMRKSGHLMSAREKFALCARPACPPFIVSDCTRWLGELDVAIPTITIRVVDGEGRDATNVRVLEGGKVLKERLDGRALALDPGERNLSIELAGHGAKTVPIYLREGETNRLVTVSFQAASPQRSSSETPSDQKRVRTTSVPTMSWVLGGLGLAAVTTGSIFWIIGETDRSRLSDSCARTSSCSQGDVDDAQRTLTVGDYAVAAGAASLVAALAIYFTLRTKDSIRPPILPFMRF